MKEEYLKIIKEKGEFDFEVSSLVETLTLEEYEELKSMLITAIGTMEEMRRNIYIENQNKDKEIERLNNIINEFEKWLDKKEKLTFNSWNKGIHEVQRKLQELKGDGNNEKI